MKSGKILLLFSFIFMSFGFLIRTDAAVTGKKKDAGNNGERQHEYMEAVNALKNQIFLLSIYSYVDNAGKVAGIEPEGNFITVNKEKFMMQKSVSLVLSTFSGSDHMKGQCSDFHYKESRKGNVQFSFVITDGDKILVFNCKMKQGDNIIEGTIKGKKEEREVFVSGNIQPVKSHFDY